MDLTKHEKYQFIQTITENHLFRADNEPSNDEARFANILAKTIIGSLCLTIINLFILVIATESNSKYAHTYIVADLPKWMQMLNDSVWLFLGIFVLSCIVSIVTSFSSNDNQDTERLDYMPNVMIRPDKHKPVMYDIESSQINEQMVATPYKSIRPHIIMEYKFLTQCADEKMFNQANKLIKSRSNLLLLTQTLNDYDLTEEADSYKLTQVRNHYLKELAQLDDDLLELITPSLKVCALQLINHNQIKYLPKRIRLDYANKKLQDVLDEVNK